MQVGTGISILNGIAIGKIKIFKAPTYEISDSLVEDPIPELDRYEKARVKAQEQQNALYIKAVKAAGEDSAGIFEFHAEMLDDDDLNDSVKSIIRASRTWHRCSKRWTTRTSRPAAPMSLM